MSKNPGAIGPTRAKRASTFSFWFTPLQAIGVAAFLANLCISTATADEWLEPASTGTHPGPALFDVTDSSMWGGISALSNDFVFLAEELFASIELSASGSGNTQDTVYLIPGMHWRAADTARFGFGFSSGPDSKVEGLALVAAFTIQFQ